MYQGPNGQPTSADQAIPRHPARLAHTLVPVLPEASVVDFMAFCAKATGCQHVPFSQGAIPGLASSCYGLSLFLAQ